MKRLRAYAITILSIAVLAAGGCRNKDDNDMQPGASNPASPATAPATPPPVNPGSSNLPPPGSSTHPGSSATAPAPSTTSAR